MCEKGEIMGEGRRNGVEGWGRRWGRGMVVVVGLVPTISVICMSLSAGTEEKGNIYLKGNIFARKYHT
jgi:hypothetical protein